MSASVLVVEDNAALAENIAELFEDIGAEVVTCTHPADALREAAERPFDLFIVDVNLPGDESGVELVPRFRELSPQGQVLLMTGAASLDTAIEAVRHGVFAYVQKPFAAGDLLALGERALSQVALHRERQALARELAHSEAIYRGVVDTVDQLIIGLDDQRRVAFCNRCATEKLGYATRDLKGSPFVDLFASDEDRHLFSRLVERAERGESVSERHLHVHTRTGDTRLVRWRLTPLSADGVVSLLLAVGLDVTETLELERRLAQSEALATIGTLTAGLAHEIRNPLNAAKLQLELLTRNAAKVGDGELAARIHDKAQVVRAEIGRLAHMLEEFLSLARPRAFELVPVPLAALLHEVAELQGPEAEEQDVDLRVSCPEAGDLCVLADPSKIKQVLVNLVTNALEAMRGAGVGTRVTVEGEPHGKSWVVLRVEDDGPGISDEHAGQLFHPFFTTKEAGTGLGLSVVKRIVEQHGGEISVGPSPEGGTIARVILRRPE